jgi:hypothetical protein
MSRLWLRIVSVTFAAIACGGAWALSSPIGSSPDDGYHQTTIWCVDASSPDSECTVVGETATGGRRVDVPAN